MTEEVTLRAKKRIAWLVARNRPFRIRARKGDYSWYVDRGGWVTDSTGSHLGHIKRLLAALEQWEVSHG